MAMRVTQGVTNRSYLYNLNTAQYNMNKSSEKMQTGRKFSRVSEDVHGAAKLMKLRVQMNRNEGVQDSINLALSDLEMTEGILTDMKDITTEVQAEMIKAMNEPTLNASKETFVAFLQESKKEILRLANKQYNDKYLFGGQNFEDEPYTVGKDGSLCYHKCEISKIYTSKVNEDSPLYYFDSIEGRQYYNSTNTDQITLDIQGFLNQYPDSKIASKSDISYIQNDIQDKPNQIDGYYNPQINNAQKEIDKYQNLYDNETDPVLKSDYLTQRDSWVTKKQNLQTEAQEQKNNVLDYDNNCVYIFDTKNKDKYGSNLYYRVSVGYDFEATYGSNETQDYYYEYDGEPIEYTHDNFIDIGLDLSHKNKSETSRYNVAVDALGLLGFGTDPKSGVSNNIYDMMTEMENIIKEDNVDFDKFSVVFEQFKKQSENLITGRAEIGVRSKYLESTISRLENENTIYEESKNRVEAVDDALEITRFKGYQSAWNTVLQFGGSIFPQSLMDYVR